MRKEKSRYPKSTIHEANGFNQGYATFYHIKGTFLSKNPLNIIYKSIDITTSPFIAFCNSTKDFIIIFINLLNLSIYCPINTPKEIIFFYTVIAKVYGFAFFLSNYFGIFDKKSFAIDATIY